jgi:hypothetical protein
LFRAYFEDVHGILLYFGKVMVTLRIEVFKKRRFKKTTRNEKSTWEAREKVAESGGEGGQWLRMGRAGN